MLTLQVCRVSPLPIGWLTVIYPHRRQPRSQLATAVRVSGESASTPVDRSFSTQVLKAKSHRNFFGGEVPWDMRICLAKRRALVRQTCTLNVFNKAVAISGLERRPPCRHQRRPRSPVLHFSGYESFENARSRSHVNATLDDELLRRPRRLSRALNDFAPCEESPPHRIDVSPTAHDQFPQENGCRH